MTTVDIFDVLTKEGVDSAIAASDLSVLATIGPAGKTFVNHLVAFDYDPNTKDRNGRSVLFEACKSSFKGSFDFIKQVVEKYKADVKAVDDFGDTPLHYAAQNSNADHACEIVDFLIAHGAKIDAVATDGKNPVLVAAAFAGAGLKVVKQLAAKDINLVRAVDKEGLNVLDHACSNGGKRDLINWLLDLTDAATGKPMFSLKGDILTKLFGFGADDSSLELAEFFVSKGVEPSVQPNGDTLLHLAVGFGVASIALAKFALEKLGININAANAAGHTPLHAACGFSCGKGNIISYLIENGASVNAKDSAGNTPLHHAIENYDTLSQKATTVELLVKAGADIHEKNNSGVSSLTAATDSDSSSDLVPLLLKEKTAADLENQKSAGDDGDAFNFDFGDSDDEDAKTDKLVDFNWDD